MSDQLSNSNSVSVLAAARSSDMAKLVIVGAVLVLLTAIAPSIHSTKWGTLTHWMIVFLTAIGAGWVAMASDHLNVRHALWTIFIVAIAMRLSLLFVHPYLSTDIFRYIWDGRVQAAGINPYRYIPNAPELADLRDPIIFPWINRADYAPTVYPPGGQMLFFIITRFGESVVAMKLGLLACEAVAIGATLVILKHLDLPLTRIAAFVWHPLAVWEIAGSGHIDAGMFALLMVGIAVFLFRRPLIAGALVTAAALMKPTALLALPVFWRPWNFKLPTVVVATAALLYLPYLAVGSKVLGFLPGYIVEEELSHGDGFRYVLIVERFFGSQPGAAISYAGVFITIMVVLSIAIGFRKDRSDHATMKALVVLLAAFLVLLTPHYPWYYLALVPFLAFFPNYWTLWLLTVGGFQTYQYGPTVQIPSYDDRQIVFHIVVLLAIARDVWAARAQRLPDLKRESSRELPR